MDGDPPVEAYDSLATASDRARELGRDGAPNGTFVVATELTAARDRNGRHRRAPPGGVWSSTLLRPRFGVERVGRLAFAGCVAATETVAAFDVDARPKWPDGVVVPGSGTVAGALTEAVVEEGSVADGAVGRGASSAPPELSFALLGVDLNADCDPAAVTGDRDVATLRDELDRPVDAAAVATTLRERVLDRAAQVETDDGFRALLDDWRERSSTLGERVRVDLRGTDEPLVGVASDLTERGALVVETDGGEVAVATGECERLRRVSA